jgi:hypothetical protein
VVRVGGQPDCGVARPPRVQLFRKPAALLRVRQALLGHRAKDDQDVVRLPAHAAQGVCQLGERLAEGDCPHNRAVVIHVKKLRCSIEREREKG